MDQMTKIAIDLDVHRTIETRRTGFGQSPNEILRDILGLSPGQSIAPAPQSRRTGSFSFTFMGEEFTESSLKEAYQSCLLRIGELDSGFFDRLARAKTKSRRIIAKNPEDLYLRKPHLARKFAQRLDGPWWYDSNLSRQQCELRLRKACDIAGLTFGGKDGDLIADFLP